MILDVYFLFKMPLIVGYYKQIFHRMYTNLTQSMLQNNIIY